MSLSVGIVGLPNVGKSTLFNALTKKSVDAVNYPFCTIDPSVGVVAVPDERLEKLSEFSHSEKTIPAAIEFVDIAGLVKGASVGEGLGNKFLANIREVQAIAQVVRIFEDTQITHVVGRIHPLEDIEIINLELILADEQTVAKRLSNIEREVKRHDKDAVFEKDILTKVLGVLQAGNMARSCVYHEEELEIITALHLLTMKPILYVLNRKAGGKNLDEVKDERWNALMKFFDENKCGWVTIDANIENEIKELAGMEKEQFRRELGAQDDGINALIRTGYALLSLETFFTTGEEETHAWTIQKGATAPEAGAAIHTDFKEKFIRAEVIEWEQLLAVGSFAKAREMGLIQTVGKEYVVTDGDVIEFKI